MIKFFIGLLAAGCITAPALAEEAAIPTAPALAEEVAIPTGTRGGFALGVEVFDYSYREKVDGANVVSDDGTFGGFSVDYVETIGSGWFLKARTRSSFGSVNYVSYEGSRLDGVPQQIAQLEFLVGHDFDFGALTVTPFAGAGGRGLLDSSGGRTTQDGLEGYDREIYYGYIPVGISARTAIGNNVTLQLSGQANFVTTGEVLNRFSIEDALTQELKVDLKGGTGWELAAAVEFPIGSHHMSLGPFARGWQINKSEIVTFEDDGDLFEAFEPENKTWEVGLRAIFAF